MGWVGVLDSDPVLGFMKILVGLKSTVGTVKAEADVLDKCEDLIPGRNQVGINSYGEVDSRNLITPWVSKFWSPWGSRKRGGEVACLGSWIFHIVYSQKADGPSW